MTPNTTRPCVLGITSETVSAWGDGLLDPAETRSLADHIQTCPACTAQLAVFAATQRAIRGQRLPDIQDQVWRRLRPRIDGSGRGQQMGRRNQVFGGLAAVAAVVLVALLAAALFNAHRAGPLSGTPTASQSVTATATHTATATATSAPSATGWTPVRLADDACTRSYIIASPADPQTMYACTANQSQQVEVSVSHDGGATWGPRLPTPVTGGPFGAPAFAVNPTNPRDLLLASAINQGVNQVYRSFNGGAHWQHLTDLGDLTFEALGWAGSTALVVTQLTESAGTPLAELYASFNGGPFGRLDHNGKLGDYDISQSPSLVITGTMLPGQPSAILLTFGQSVSPVFTTTVRSVDGGATWQQVTFKETNGSVIAPLAASQDGGALVGILQAAPTAAVSSGDAGQDWNAAPGIPDGTNHFNQLLVVGDGTVFATAGPASSESENRNIYELRPGTSAWTTVASLQQSSMDYTIVVQQDAHGHAVALWAVEAGRLSVFRL
jgi:hypothetical protein